MRFINRGLVPAAEAGMSAGIDLSLRRLAALWPAALKAKIVELPFKTARPLIVQAALRSPQERALDEDEEGWIRRFIRLFALGALVRLLTQQDGALQRELRRVYAQAQQDNLTTEEYRKAIQQVGRRFGSEGIQDADLGAGFIQSTIIAPLFAKSEKAVAGAPLARSVTPYWEFITRNDDKVRDNHAALHGFVAAAAWDGWEREVLPPLGFNCRCRAIPLPWFVTQTLGYQGVFPGGVGQLEQFRAMGGADEGFPRSQFVVGAAA